MKKTALLLIIIFASALTVQTQSLADFARQERERRKNVVSKIIITNETLNSGKGPSPAPPSTAAPAADPDKTQARASTPSNPVTNPTDNNGRDEKSWRAAFAQAREELTRAENQVKASELKLNQLNRDYIQRSDIYNKEQQAVAQLNAANAELNLARKGVEQAQQRISQLEDELRRAGGPAGWGR